MSNFGTYLRPGENDEALLDIMTSEKVTLPVARNILKMRQLGLNTGRSAGPALDPSALPTDRGRTMPDPSVLPGDRAKSIARGSDRRADDRYGHEDRRAAASREYRGERERNDRDAYDDRGRHDGRHDYRDGRSVDPTPARQLAAAFENDDDEPRRLRQARRPVGIGRLGPVEAREEDTALHTPGQSSRSAVEPREAAQEDSAKAKKGKLTAAARLGFEVDDDEVEKARKRNKDLGISRLGPVESRFEQVDPLVKKKDTLLQRGKSDDKDDEEDEEERMAALAAAEDERRTRLVALQAEEERRRQSKRKQRLQDALQGGDASSGQADATQSKESKQKKARTGSSDSDSEQERNPKGIMTEAEILAMMKKERKAGTSRGSIRAQNRIQQEWLEWEKTKQKNSEYWKPPKHCLVTKDVYVGGRGRR